MRKNHELNSIPFSSPTPRKHHRASLVLRHQCATVDNEDVICGGLISSGATADSFNIFTRCAPERMSMDVTFLGTGSAYPSPHRGASALVLRTEGECWLFDAGEGTQTQLMKSQIRAGESATAAAFWRSRGINN